ncbi:MAG: metallophosphoesterase [Paludibacteraceae bacterium]|nr:metallophosphoesterase [Paludibacteraceae bacterium]
MKKWVYGIVITLLVAGAAALCIVRWQAWFGMPDEPEWKGAQRTYTFPFFTQDTTPESLDILVLGDIHNRLTRADYDTLAARVPQVDAVAQTGDWLERGQGYYYQWLLREWTGSQLFGTPVIPCPGNHEYSKGWFKQVSPVWESAFEHPHNGPIEVPGASYYFDYTDLRLIVIDTNPLDRLVYLTRTLTWLCEAMYTADDRFIVVMMHHPVLSPGKGRCNPLIYTTFRHALADADLVIAGHDHSYMRRGPFVVMNTAGKNKAQHIRCIADVTDTVPTYSVLSIKRTDVSYQPSPLTFNTYRLSDGQVVDIVYVKHH